MHCPWLLDRFLLRAVSTSVFFFLVSFILPNLPPNWFYGNSSFPSDSEQDTPSASLSMGTLPITECTILLNPRISAPMMSRTQNLICYRDLTTKLQSLSHKKLPSSSYLTTWATDPSTNLFFPQDKIKQGSFCSSPAHPAQLNPSRPGGSSLSSLLASSSGKRALIGSSSKWGVNLCSFSLFF